MVNREGTKFMPGKKERVQEPSVIPEHRHPYFVTISGIDKGREYELKRSPSIIGRDEKSDIILNCSSVSRRHAILTLVGKEWRIKDLDSTNGTMLNGSYIKKESPIQPGDKIGIGKEILELRLP